MREETRHESGEPITLLLPGGGPLGVAYEAGALICLEDLFTGGFLQHARAIIGSSAGAVTGAFLTMGLTPQLLVKSLSGRFPDEIEYFDPSILLQFDRDQVPSPFLGLWRSMRFFLAELRRGTDREAPLDERRERYEHYLSRVEDIINLVPKGWFSLTGLEKFLHRNLASRHGRLYDFDHFATDLFICATDLTDGHAVLFGKKRFQDQVTNSPFFSKHDYVTGATLAHAVVSSSAIPFLFLPYRDRQMILADGDTRNTTAVSVARSLVNARFMITINPLVPLRNVKRNCSTAELFLQALLTALEGNIVATLKMEFEEKYRRERAGEDTFDIVYFRPSATDMATMTGNSIINLFRYKPLNALMGYRAVFETVRDHPDEAEMILRRYGYRFDLTIPARRYALMQRRRNDPEALEDVLLTPAQEIEPIE
ncbi:MAG: Patatin [Deltaproteobacteria bacterium]|nr:Patatin [Deltaproteobacteria bacterium]